MLIWRRQYRPFIFGGSPERLVKCEYPADDGPHDLGGGFTGYLITTPKKHRTYVVESTSGAILGDSLEMVRGDIAVGDQMFMTVQIADACQQRELADFISVDEFFRNE